jgi:heavy metal translocating P-type ATPase
MADRYGVVFLMLTIVLAGSAWLLTRDPLRALAVLVIATPCPLILAVPVAMISGLSKAAGRDVMIKGGIVLEALGNVTVALLDKTGTLTKGQATVVDIRTVKNFSKDELLRIAASLDQASTHVMAVALVMAAKACGLRLSPPKNVIESAGTGLEGTVDEHHVVIGGSGFVKSRSTQGDPADFRQGLSGLEAVVAVAVDGIVSGVIAMNDAIRNDAVETIAQLRRIGITRIVLASGDHAYIAREVGQSLGVDDVFCELHPTAKAALVNAEKKHGLVMMVGDGVNDAPALASADVGVAMGARGSAASSEVADIVILVDQIEPLVDAVRIAHRTLFIAWQCIIIGLGLSLAGMSAAALGYLPPLQGAVLQEVIDVAVIFNALRALR